MRDLKLVIHFLILNINSLTFSRFELGHSLHFPSN